jgi:hypothetical protein
MAALLSLPPKTKKKYVNDHCNRELRRFLEAAHAHLVIS